MTVLAPHQAAPAAARPKAGPSRRGRGLRHLLTATPFILPSLAGVLLFLVVPVVIVLVLSFFQWNFLQPPQWAGFGNFARMTRNYHVFRALGTTAFYVLWNIPIQTVIALGLAMLLNRKLPAMGFFRALYCTSRRSPSRPQVRRSTPPGTPTPWTRSSSAARPARANRTNHSQERRLPMITDSLVPNTTRTFRDHR